MKYSKLTNLQPKCVLNLTHKENIYSSYKTSDTKFNVDLCEAVESVRSSVQNCSLFFQDSHEVGRTFWHGSLLQRRAAQARDSR